MDPPDSKQTAQSHKLLHLHWIPSITQTTLPTPPHDRLLSKQVFGFDIEPTVELHDATPPCVFSPPPRKKQAFVLAGAIFRAVHKTVAYIDFSRHAYVKSFLGYHLKKKKKYSLYKTVRVGQCRRIHSRPACVLITIRDFIFCPLTTMQSVTRLLRTGKCN